MLQSGKSLAISRGIYDLPDEDGAFRSRFNCALSVNAVSIAKKTISLLVLSCFIVSDKVLIILFMLISSKNAHFIPKVSSLYKTLFSLLWISCLDSLVHYNTGTNIKAWLFTIMRNIFINDYRRKSKQKTIFDNTPNDYPLDYKQSTIINDAESDMRLKEVRKAVEELPEIFKTPFKLYFDGYKYNEIAAALGEPLGTIKSRIHFARKLLKEQINRN